MVASWFLFLLHTSFMIPMPNSIYKHEIRFKRVQGVRREECVVGHLDPGHIALGFVQHVLLSSTITNSKTLRYLAVDVK